MRAVLEYNLPEDKDDFELATRAIDWYLAMWDLDQWLREQVKYQGHRYDEKALDAFDLVREKIRENMIERNIGFD